ncbi:hypothetical protein F8M41_001679 [Gigaspora margarita]|uniref:Uncharacterized protein n=1 Tax=Gigaspora margarita TaxID=4874 RepID=A0A8H4A7L4_GIGMA|nr:hypothetical protein F8M41_001679 [Gigaspora margarita]
MKQNARSLRFVDMKYNGSIGYKKVNRKSSLRSKGIVSINMSGQGKPNIEEKTKFKFNPEGPDEGKTGRDECDKDEMKMFERQQRSTKMGHIEGTYKVKCRYENGERDENEKVKKEKEC